MKTKIFFQKLVRVFLMIVMLGNISIVPGQMVAAKSLAAFTNCAAQSEIPTAECDALVALYTSTDGANWYNNTYWLQTNTPCSWVNVTCDQPLPAVTTVSGLSLGVNNLSGTIPPALGNLTGIAALDLQSNQLTGSIPPELGNLTNLATLNLQDNELSGPIPAELGGLTNLTTLYLQNNLLDSSIPTELESLAQLQYLYLYNNQLTGSIPTGLGSLSNLSILELYNNQLTGTIPTELGNLTSLIILELNNNLLTGSIPTELGSLTSLTNLELNSNQLTGSIPSGLGSMTSLQILYLGTNQLSGELPTSITNLTQLIEISFDLCAGLTSSDQTVIDFIETFIPNWTLCTPLITALSPNNGPVNGGTSVIISGEKFTGTSAVTFDGASVSFTVDNSGQITTTSPAHAAGAVDVIITNSHGDSSPITFTYYGPFINCASQPQIPETECDALVALYNSTNGANWTHHTNWLQAYTPCSWYGVICEVGTNVTQLNFPINHLDGSLPTELGNLTELQSLDLGNNQLSGEIPASFTNLINLIDLTLSCGLTSTNQTVISFINDILGTGWDDSCPTTPTPTRTLTPTPTRTATPTATRTATPSPTIIVQTFTSAAAQDGWVLESSETSSKGGTLNGKTVTVSLGDNTAKKQYRSILSFSTGAGLPDTAVITGVTLKVKKQGIGGGGNPVSIFKGFMVDIKNGTFGTAALQTADFQATPSKVYGPFSPALVNSWYSINLTGADAYVNKLATNGGLTQIRLRFKLDDNNNAIANYLSLYSGSAPAASRPQLVITYIVP